MVTLFIFAFRLQEQPPRKLHVSFMLFIRIREQIHMATATYPQDPDERQRRKFKGHSWSKKGSKASRRQARELARKPRFYVVAKGYRPGIYRKWCNAAAQVNGYGQNVHKNFPTLNEAQEFMRLHRQFPPSIRTPFPPTPDTPLHPDEYVYPNYDDTESDSPGDSDGCVPFVPTIQVGPPMDRAKFAEVAAIAKRIAADTENLMLDVSECPCKNCPYSIF